MRLNNPSQLSNSEHISRLLHRGGLFLSGLLGGLLHGFLDILAVSFLFGLDGKGFVFLGLVDLEDIGLLDGASVAAGGVVRHHDRDADTDNTLLEADAADGRVDVVSGSLTGFNHVTVLKLHGLGTLASQLTRNNELATLSAVLHDVSKNAVACATHGEATEQLKAKGLALGDGAESAVLDAGGVQLNVVLGEVEPLLHKRGELSDASALVSEDVLCAGGADDDFRADGGHADLDTRVSILSELAGEELVELAVEDTVLDELALLSNGGHVFCS